VALTDPLPTITAYANDVGYEVILPELLENFAQPGDLSRAISGSGNSSDVMLAIASANSIGCRGIALTGRDRGNWDSRPN
jgi:D-sedoheptulose 7-phosphate isomerase